MSGSSSSPSQQQARPDPSWTSRQRQVLDLLVRGDTNPEIAQALGISLDGAKWHVSEVITKLGVDSRDEAAEYWRAHNGLRLRFTRFVHAVVSSLWLKVAGSVAVVAGASVAIAVVVVALHGSGPVRPSPTASPTATPRSEPYDDATQFAATDLFDLSRLPGVQTAGWQKSGNLSDTLATSLPPEWVTSPSDAALTASKPLAAGQTVGICRTVPGWSKLDMSADAAPVEITKPDANVIRDMIELLPTNGLTVEVIQISGSTQCGPNFGKLSIIPRPPFKGSFAINGAATVDFPATAAEIATAFAIMDSITTK